MNVLTVKKVSTDDLAKKVIKNVKHNIHVLGNDRDFLYHEMNSKVINTIKENQADGFLNDIKNAYYLNCYSIADYHEKYLSGKNFLKAYDIYTVSDGLKLIKSISKKGYITLHNVLNTGIDYPANNNRNHIPLKDISKYGSSDFSIMYDDTIDMTKDTHQKFMKLDSFGNSSSYNDVNDLISMLSNLTNYFKNKLNFITSKKGYKSLTFCLTVDNIKQLPTDLEDQALTKFIGKLFNSKDLQISSGMENMKETWHIDTTDNWLKGLKHDIKQGKIQQYDGYKDDLAVEVPHLKQVEKLAKQGFKYVYEETPSDDKMYAIDNSASGVTAPFFEQLYDAIFDNY